MAEAAKSSQVVTNDTYVEGRGYYHAPFGAWYPHPYNFFAPGMGFYRGGSYFSQPDLRVPPPTMPGRMMNDPRPNVGANENRSHATTAPNPSRNSDSSGNSLSSVRRGGFTGSRSWGYSSGS